MTTLRGLAIGFGVCLLLAIVSNWMSTGEDSTAYLLNRVSRVTGATIAVAWFVAWWFSSDHDEQ